MNTFDLTNCIFIVAIFCIFLIAKNCINVIAGYNLLQLVCVCCFELPIQIEYTTVYMY